MTTTRPSLIANLKAKFNNPRSGYNYSECINKSAKALKNKFYTRFFDDYPPLLNADDMFHLHERYIDILRRLPKESINEDYKIIGQDDIKSDFERLITDIARIGSEELFDYANATIEVSSDDKSQVVEKYLIIKDLALNPALSTYLQLNLQNPDISPTGHPEDFTISYLAAVMAELESSAEEHIHLYTKAHIALNNYLCSNLREFANKAILRPCNTLDLVDDDACMRNMLYYYPEHKLEAAIAVGATLTLGALGAAGYLFFKGIKAAKTAKAELNEEQEDDIYSHAASLR